LNFDFERRAEMRNDCYWQWLAFC